MKLNTRNLLIVLVVLIVAFGVTQLTKRSGRSKSLRSELVSIDTTQVSGIEITSPDGICILSETEDGWKVRLIDGTQKKAKKDAIDGLLNSLMTIKPGRLAAKTSDKWKDYAVDSAGTRIKVYEGEDLTNDIVIGRFGMEGQQSFYTFVRLYEDVEVYTAPNFMGMSIGKTSDDFRDNRLISLKKDSLTAITFDYPDSAFNLTKNEYWFVGDQIADSTAIIEYLNELSYVTSTEFFDQEINADAAMRVSFSFSNQSDLTLAGYFFGEQMVVKSESNTSESFLDPELVSKIFKRKNDFLPTSE